MNEILILDGNLAVIDMLDHYTSLIWVNRYWDNGDCEVYVAATPELIAELVPGRYLKRRDDDMICKIVKVELSTDAENGDYLIITGIDAKSLLDQRIIWNTTTAQGKAEDFMRQLVTDALITPLISERRATRTDDYDILALDTLQNLTAETTEQVTYKNLGTKIREICTRYGYGYRFKLGSGIFLFGVYNGQDLSDQVIFSDDFDNLISTDYTDDRTDIQNVALVAGSGEGALRIRQTAGVASGVDRYEIFVDAKDNAQTMTYAELKAAYPLTANGGYGYIGSTGGSSRVYYYYMERFDIQIFDNAQLLAVQNKWPGGVVVSSLGGLYRWYRVTDVPIAALPSATPADEDTVTLEVIAYWPRLISQGYDNLAGHEPVQTFDAEIEPSTTFTYKTDYNLGDIVTVKSKYGVTVNARIVEIAEVFDETGYHMTPKLEYIS